MLGFIIFIIIYCYQDFGYLNDIGTIAVDPSVIPFGKRVMINGHIYTAEDSGSKIKGNRIDIFMSTHEEAKQFGVKQAEEFLVE